jgi:hypothetical protein
MSSPKDDPLATVAAYIVESEARYALTTARLRRIQEEGRDTSGAERALRDLEETLTLLRQRQWSLQLEARSRRLLVLTPGEAVQVAASRFPTSHPGHASGPP